MPLCKREELYIPGCAFTHEFSYPVAGTGGTEFELPVIVIELVAFLGWAQGGQETRNEMYPIIALPLVFDGDHAIAPFDTQGRVNGSIWSPRECCSGM